MSATYKIIDNTKFVNYRALSLNQDNTRQLDPYILEAQQFDLRPLMGDAFYWEFIKGLNVAIPASKWLDLRDGREYTNDCDDDVRFAGIEAVLVYFTYARYIRKKNITDTPFGFKVNNQQNSLNVDAKTVAGEVTDARSGALSYWYQVRDFLNTQEFNTIYDKWDCGDVKPSTGGLKITKVG